MPIYYNHARILNKVVGVGYNEFLPNPSFPRIVYHELLPAQGGIVSYQQRSMDQVEST